MDGFSWIMLKSNTWFSMDCIANKICLSLHNHNHPRVGGQETTNYNNSTGVSWDAEEESVEDTDRKQEGVQLIIYYFLEQLKTQNIQCYSQAEQSTNSNPVLKDIVTILIGFDWDKYGKTEKVRVEKSSGGQR